MRFRSFSRKRNINTLVTVTVTVYKYCYLLSYLLQCQQDSAEHIVTTQYLIRYFLLLEGLLKTIETIDGSLTVSLLLQKSRLLPLLEVCNFLKIFERI